MSKSRIEGLIQLLTDPENQPHQYLNNPNGLRQALIDYNPIYRITCSTRFKGDRVTYVDLDRISAITEPYYDNQCIVIVMYLKDSGTPLLIQGDILYPGTSSERACLLMKERVFIPLFNAWEKWKLIKD